MPSKPDLAASYLPYIRRIAYRLARRLPPHILVDDLISAGCEGLLDALNKFDPTRIERFEKYAEYRVRGEMLDALRTLDPLGRNTRGRSNKLAAAIRDLSQQLGREPDENEIAQALGCTIESYRQLVEAVSHANVLSLEDLVDENHTGLADATAKDPEAEAEHAELREQLTRAIGELRTRHRLVLQLYYVEGFKLREIGEILNVSDSRVCQIHAEAVVRLRALLLHPEFPDKDPAELLAGTTYAIYCPDGTIILNLTLDTDEKEEEEDQSASEAARSACQLPR